VSVKWWNSNKMVLSPVAALIMWTVSVLCFVFGLSFKNPVGYVLGGMDVSMWVAFSLSLANTIIQLIGNGKKMSEMDEVFKAGWIASYALGIASNVNALLNILGMGNVFLEWVVALSLGTMIEVMPEKLIVMWLKSIPEKVAQPSNNKVSHITHQMQNLPRQQPYKPGIPTKSSFPVPHKSAKPYPRPSSYLDALHRDEEDGELVG
jgi:hypothetical protein